MGTVETVLLIGAVIAVVAFLVRRNRKGSSGGSNGGGGVDPSPGPVNPPKYKEKQK